LSVTAVGTLDNPPTNSTNAACAYCRLHIVGSSILFNMGGLARICKMYGSMEVSDANGKKVTWLWDYKNDKPRLKSEMTKEDIAESEKAKWEQIKAQMSGS